MRSQDALLPSFEELKARGESAFTGPETQELLQRTDQTLVSFLRVDLDTGAMFARIAKRHKEDRQLEEYRRALRVARKALETVRYFESRVADLSERSMIRVRGDELEKFVSSL